MLVKCYCKCMKSKEFYLWKIRIYADNGKDKGLYRKNASLAWD